jgi:uncharacterized membrane protein YbhN (UPF0104 family)
VAAPGAARWARSLALPAAGTAAVLAACAAALHDVDRAAVGRAVAGAWSPWLAAAAAVFVSEAWLRAVALSVLLGPTAAVPVGRLFRYVCVSRAAAAVLPWRLGEAAPVLLLRAGEGVAPEVTVAVLLAEKVAAAIALALLAAPLPLWLALPWGVGLTAAALALGGALAAALALAALARGPALARLVTVAATIGRPRTAAVVLVTALAQWGADAVAIHLCLRAAGLALPLYTPVLMEVLTTAAGLVPTLAPAHLGTFEGGVVAALAVVGLRGSAAVAFALLLHAAQVAPLALAGAAALPGVRGLSARRAAP